MKIEGILTSCSFPQISQERVINGIKVAFAALAALGIIYKNLSLAVVGIGGAIACCFSRKPIDRPIETPLEIPPFVCAQFECPWENLYMPLFNKLLSLNAIGPGIVWVKGMSTFLETHDIWFEEGRFHVAKKTGEPKDDVRTFYALLSLMYGCQDEYLKMVSIHHLLIRPFLSRVPAQVVQATYWPLQIAMFRRAKRGRSLAFDDIGVQTPEGRAAISIQRAFRRYQSQKISFPPRLEPYSFSVSSHLPIPLASNAIRQEKAEEWIYAHKEKVQTTARKFIQSIRHVSFKQFTQRLQAAAQSFNTYLMGLPESQRKFVIIIPRNKIHSSNKWVTELALPFFKKPPEDVILSDQFEEFKSRHPEVKRAVLLDDAAYSGKQLRNILNSLPGEGYRFHAVVPYTTLMGICRIANEGIWMSEHERMLSVEDLCKMGVFTQKEKEVLEQATDSYDQGDLTGRSLTYFDHKIADHLSTYDKILKYGSLLVANGFQYIEFIPSTKSPYASSFLR